MCSQASGAMNLDGPCSIRSDFVVNCKPDQVVVTPFIKHTNPKHSKNMFYQLHLVIKPAFGKGVCSRSSRPSWLAVCTDSRSELW